MPFDRHHRSRRRALALALLVTFLAPSVPAHEIPSDVIVQAFVKPEGDRLRVLLRMPLRAMRDVQFPERGQNYLDIDRVQPFLHDAATLWIVNSLTFLEEDTPLENGDIVRTGLALESDKSFSSYEAALSRINGAGLPKETNVAWHQTMFDVMLEYKIRSANSHFSLRSGLARLGLKVVMALSYVLPSGEVRGFELMGDPGLVPLDPRWLQAVVRFIDTGFRHILDGTDHLLFLLCLVIPFRRLKPLIAVITAFTVAHSITLIASAYDLAPSALWFPPLIETLIAASIVYMALENVVRASSPSAALGFKIERWAIAFGFGLVHGFGFSFALRQTLQFAGSHMLTSLLSFNIGVELGQLLVLAITVPLLSLLFRFGVGEKIGSIILSALVAHTGWHWMTERAAQLSQYRFTWPDMTAAFLASVARGLMGLLLLAGLFWFIQNVVRSKFERGRNPGQPSESETP